MDKKMLRENPVEIVVVDEGNIELQKQLITKGIAMLIVPKNATTIEKQMLLSRYSNSRFRLVIFERCDEIDI